MAKNLEVVRPFDVMNVGDTFELSEDGNTYVCEYTEENAESSDSGSQFSSKFHSSYSISKSYAESLIEDGYLKELKEPSPFVNVFDEIDTLLEDYTAELNDIDETYAQFPACLKIERETVLRNMCTLLKHLKGLKK